MFVDFAFAISSPTKSMQSGEDADLNITGSNVISDAGTTLNAGRDVNISAAENSYTSNTFNETHRSGFSASLSGGVASIGYGKNKGSLSQQATNTILTGSQVSSANGDTTIVGNGDVNVFASKLSAGGDIGIQSTNINLLAGEESYQSDSEAKSKSSGLSIGVTYSPTLAGASAYEKNRNSGDFSDSAVGKWMQHDMGVLKGSMAAATPIVFTAGHNKQSQTQNVQGTTLISSEISAGGDLTMIATGGDITSLGTQMSAEGDALLSATGDIALSFGREGKAQTGDSQQSGWNIDNRDWLLPAGTYNDKSQASGELDEATGTVLSVGGQATLQTETGDINIFGSSVVSTEETILNAGRDVNILSTQNSYANQESQSSKGIGSAQISDTEHFSGYMASDSAFRSDSVEQVRASVGSLEGDVLVQAGRDYNQQVADVVAGKDIIIRAETINILQDSNRGSSEQSSNDLKVGQFTKVSSPLINLVNKVDEATTSNASGRVQALQGLAAAGQAYQVASAYQGGAIAKVETGFGFKTAESEQTNSYTLSQNNTVNAGGNVSLVSTKGDIHLQNTAVSAGDLIALNSAKDILLESGQSQHKADGSNSYAGASAGAGASIGAETGVFVYVDASWGSGENHLDSNTHQNTTLNSDKLSIVSQGDTSLIGATATANRIDADIGGKLKIVSPQDEVEQSSTQSGAGIHLQVSLGTAWNASGNHSKSQAEGNYQAVNRQSGLFAGDGGFDVNVGGVTELKGGMITSTAKAEAEGNNAFSTGAITVGDVYNYSEYDGSSIALGAGTSDAGGLSDKSVGYASDDAFESSVTRAGIGTANITITDKDKQAEVQPGVLSDITSIQTTVTTDEALTATGLKNRFDSAQLLSDLQTEASVTQEAGQMLPNLVATYAQSQTETYDNAQVQKAGIEAALEKTTDPATRAELMQALSTVQATLDAEQATYDMWTEGGAARVALHTAVGGLLTGDVSGAVGAGTTATLAPQIDKISDSLPDGVQAGFDLITGVALGAITGGESGAVAAANIDWNNRQLHQAEIDAIKENAAKFAEEQGNGMTVEEATSILSVETLRGVSDDFANVEENTAARDFLNGLEIAGQQQDGQTLFGVLDRNSDEYKNSFINASHIKNALDIYNGIDINKANTASYLYNHISKEVPYLSETTKEDMEDYISDVQDVAGAYRAYAEQIREAGQNGEFGEDIDYSLVAGRLERLATGMEENLGSAAVHSGHYSVLDMYNGSKGGEVLAWANSASVGANADLGIALGIKSGLEKVTQAAEAGATTGKVTKEAAEAAATKGADDVTETVVGKADNIAEDVTSNLDDISSNQSWLNEADGFTESGQGIRYNEHSTAIGDDTATVNNFNNVTHSDNGHNVIIHGALDYDEIGGIPVLNSNTTVKVRGGTETVAQSTPISVEQVAEAVRMNPNYVEGTPVCFGSCWSGSSGTAQQLANELGTPVYAPTRPVAWDSVNNRWIQRPPRNLDDYNDIESEWKMFYPNK